MGSIVPQIPMPGQHFASAKDQQRNGVMERSIILEELPDVLSDIAKCLAKFLLDLLENNLHWITRQLLLCFWTFIRIARALAMVWWKTGRITIESSRRPWTNERGDSSARGGRGPLPLHELRRQL